MSDRIQQGTSWSDRLAFLQQFLRHPRQVASIVPSTRFLERRIARCVRGRSGVIVELGPGTGGITRALLESVSADARLIAVELNPTLAARVARIDDPRLVVHCGSAIDLPAVLREHGCERASAVVSGLPFSTIGRRHGRRILDAVERSLAADGEFIAYHVRGTLERLAGSRFEAIDSSTEWLSVPPMRVYRWRRARNRVGTGHLGAVPGRVTSALRQSPAT
jgi:phosphatidylethanolamine/phosphatidyl-N-methylethanolamine N-methyltransferase